MIQNELPPIEWPAIGTIIILILSLMVIILYGSMEETENYKRFYWFI